MKKVLEIPCILCIFSQNLIKIRTLCTFAQYDCSFYCPSEVTLDHWLAKEYVVKTLINADMCEFTYPKVHYLGLRLNCRCFICHLNKADIRISHVPSFRRMNTLSGGGNSVSLGFVSLLKRSIFKYQISYVLDD